MPSSIASSIVFVSLGYWLYSGVGPSVVCGFPLTNGSFNMKKKFPGEPGQRLSNFRTESELKSIDSFKNRVLSEGSRFFFVVVFCFAFDGLA